MEISSLTRLVCRKKKLHPVNIVSGKAYKSQIVHHSHTKMEGQNDCFFIFNTTKITNVFSPEMGFQSIG